MGKNPLNGNLQQEIHETAVYLGKRIDMLELRLEERLTQIKNEILESLEKVYQELVGMRQEFILHHGQHVRTDETLEDHEGRIKKLESLTAPKI